MKFLIYFLGCKVNSYESEAIAQTLKNRGYIEVSEENNPDLIIINTCAVTETSSSKSRKIIRHFRNTFPNAIIAVMGCYSQYDYEYISNNIGANIVIGTSNRDKLPELIDEYQKNHKNVALHDEFKNIKKYESLNLESYFEKTRAYVKIQDGCNNFCTYCLIPYVRGRSRSRNKEEILDEIKNLIKNGYKEIILTGIDMGSYGLDLYENYNFSSLLEDILKENKDLYRLRISSLEESQIDDHFLNLLKNYPNIANHLHIPLQSGSKKILKLMNRKYDLENFVTKVKKIREIRSDISITTDVIVGFPSESDEDFNETYAFIETIKFAKVHVFPYSDRTGTFASKMPNKVIPQIKKERVNKLLALSLNLEKEYEVNFYNKNIDFLIESFDKKIKAYKGHSSNYLECIYKSNENLKGEVINITFNEQNSALIFDSVKKN